MHAAASCPSDADPLADRVPLGSVSHSHNSANSLVPQHRRVLGDSPFIFEDRQIGMAEAAVLDFHFDLFGVERSEVNLLANQLLLSPGGNPCINLRYLISFSVHGSTGTRLKRPV